MAVVSQFQNYNGTTQATFTQTGTYSSPVDIGGGHLVGMYSDNWPTAAGSIVPRASWNPTGTGYPVQTADGTALKVLAFGSGTFYTMHSEPNAMTHALQYLTLQIGTAGTAGVAAGGTIVLVVES
jgi:hypothetical protein